MINHSFYPADEHIPPRDKVPPQEQVISLYIGLAVLSKMRQEAGLEAMLEYMESCLLIIEEHNPELKLAVIKALDIINVAQIYREARKYDGKS